LARGSVVFALALAGCPSTPVYDCPEEGEYIEAGVGRYCAYGVVIGGFDCPADLPNRFDFESDDPAIPDGFVCSDRPIGSRDDVPMAVCSRLPACGRPTMDAGPRDAASFDAGTLSCVGNAAPSAPSPDGAGFCCLPRAPTCDCAEAGSFAADPEQCIRGFTPGRVCDVPPPDWSGCPVDEHGCPHVTFTFPSPKCCNCPRDAGMPRYT
jgi:hypothetical protein